MEEILVKTHLIITDIHDEYHMNWCGKIANAKPLLKDGLPQFIIIGSTGIYELDLEGLSEITHISFDPSSIESINKNNNAYLIVDVICGN